MNKCKYANAITNSKGLVGFVLSNNSPGIIEAFKPDILDNNKITYHPGDSYFQYGQVNTTKDRSDYLICSYNVNNLAKHIIKEYLLFPNKNEHLVAATGYYEFGIRTRKGADLDGYLEELNESFSNYDISIFGPELSINGFSGLCVFRHKEMIKDDKIMAKIKELNLTST